MKKLADFKDAKAIEAVATLLPSLTKIVSSDAFRKGNPKNKLELATLILNADAEAAMEILAVFNETPREDFHITGTQVLAGVLSMIEDKEFMALFLPPKQTSDEKPLESVSANTEETE